MPALRITSAVSGSSTMAQRKNVVKPKRDAEARDHAGIAAGSFMHRRTAVARRSTGTAAAPS